MTDMTTLANPFHVWGALARGLRDRYVAHLVGEHPASAYAAEVAGKLAALITHCEHLGISLERLGRHDREAYCAFLRALEEP